MSGTPTSKEVTMNATEWAIVSDFLTALAVWLVNLFAGFRKKKVEPPSEEQINV